MRINILKRLESGVDSYRLTLSRILNQVNKYLDIIDGSGTLITDDYGWDDYDDEEIEEIIDEEVEIGGKIKVKLADMDLIRFKADLSSDQLLLTSLLKEAEGVKPETDSKLEKLKHRIGLKIKHPINDGNKKNYYIYSLF